MKTITAFETSDKSRFYDETEARTHERRYDFGNCIESAVRGNPEFARLDKPLLVDFFMKHGTTIGKLADSPITPHPLPPRTGGPVSVVNNILVGEKSAEAIAARPVRSPPELAMPYTPSRPSVTADGKPGPQPDAYREGAEAIREAMSPRRGETLDLTKPRATANFSEDLAQSRAEGMEPSKADRWDADLPKTKSRVVDPSEFGSLDEELESTLARSLGIRS